MHKIDRTKVPAAPRSSRLMRAVAVTEAVKGMVIFSAGFGLLALLHRDVRHLATSLVTHLHLDQDRHYVGVFVELAGSLTDARLWLLAALALLYSSVRTAEAYGLWFERRWAAWLGAGSGALYLPIEVYELWHRPGAVKVATLLLNIGLVTYLVGSLRRRQRCPASTALA